MKELQILISKKGTRVVTASNLYYILELPNKHFVSNFSKWLEDVYEFRDGIRQPASLKDYAQKPSKENPLLVDFYLSLELAKLITLASKSKHKKKYAKWLRVQEAYELKDKKKVLAQNQLNQLPAAKNLANNFALTLW